MSPHLTKRNESYCILKCGIHAPDFRRNLMHPFCSKSTVLKMETASSHETLVHILLHLQGSPVSWKWRQRAAFEWASEIQIKFTNIWLSSVFVFNAWMVYQSLDFLSHIFSDMLKPPFLLQKGTGNFPSTSASSGYKLVVSNRRLMVSRFYVKLLW
jgi:hypothetical protein